MEILTNEQKTVIITKLMDISVFKIGLDKETFNNLYKIPNNKKHAKYIIWRSHAVVKEKHILGIRFSILSQSVNHIQACRPSINSWAGPIDSYL